MLEVYPGGEANFDLEFQAFPHVNNSQVHDYELDIDSIAEGLTVIQFFVFIGRTFTLNLTLLQSLTLS